uniref:Selenoprotein S n=1 Tax=Lotharella oceanica TaxID=641309 RepID=A0A7S2TZZ9_9EUKA|mmetsp:Transcript_3801/g.7310  ORF Transcript_3801/g.7310 Transcript_3801/m.7310 type:complete len:149 (+) Transcript_3801:80-526(+)
MADPSSGPENGGSSLMPDTIVPEWLWVFLGTAIRLIEDNGWLMMFGCVVLYMGYKIICAKKYKMVGSAPDYDEQMRLARERQQQRLAEEAKNNPAKKTKLKDERAKKARRDKRRFNPDAAWIQGENMSGTSNFRPDFRQRYKGRGGGG